MKKPAKRTLKIIIAAIALVLLVLGLWLFFANRGDKTEYLTAKVAYGNLEESVLATGKLQAFKLVDVGAQVTGQISKLNVAVGDTVKAGEVIAQIDPRTQRNQLQTAEASLSSNRAALLSQQANLTQARQQLDRQEKMFAVGATSKEALQAAQATFKSAQAALTQAKAQIEQSQVNVETAKLNLGYTTLVAPIDGTVVAAPVEEGQTLNAGLNTPTVVKLAQLDKMTIKAEISEADVSRVKPGMAAYFTLLGNNQKRYQTVLRSLDPGPQSVSDNKTSTGTDGTAIYYYGLLDVPNPDGVLRMDMTANVVIVVAKKTHVLKIPATALKSGKDGKTSVQVLDPERKVHDREVQIGMSDGVDTEIVSGLKEGEEVVIGTGSSAPGELPNRMPRR